MSDSARLQFFIRTCTADERAEYNNLKGPGSQARKQAFRTLIESQRLMNAKAGQVQTKSLTDTTQRVGTYRNFWVIAEKEGGLMDRETGIRIATSICNSCEKRGPPAVMYDPIGKVLKFLHCEIGVSEAESTMRQNILSADIDMPEDAIKQAMQQGASDGLLADIPADAFGKLPSVCVDGNKSEHRAVCAAVGCADLKPEPAPEITHPAVTPIKIQPPIVAASPVEPTASFQSLLAAQLQHSSASPASTSQVLQTMLLSSLMTQHQPEAGPIIDRSPEKEKTPPPPIREPKHKTVSEKLWQECLVLGRKLEGMDTNGRSIIKHTLDKNNVWYWARNEVTMLTEQLDAVGTTIYMWSSTMRSSTFALFLKVNGNTAESILIKIKTDIDAAIANVEEPLSELISMHQAKLRKRALEGKPMKAKQPKRVKGVPV
jgi:hypothetical protein